MIELETIKARLVDQTIYDIRFSQGMDIELPDLDSNNKFNPIIFLGYGMLTNSHPESAIALSPYEINADDVLTNYIFKIACVPTDFVTVFKTIYKATSSWNPNNPGDINTGFMFLDGLPIGVNNGTLWYLTQWRIQFPTNTLLQV